MFGNMPDFFYGIDLEPKGCAVNNKKVKAETQAERLKIIDNPRMRHQRGGEWRRPSAKGCKKNWLSQN